MNPTIAISSELSMRVLRPSDSGTLYMLVDRNREHLREWLPWVDSTRSPGDSRHFVEGCLQQYQSGNAVHYGVRVRGQLVGVLGFHGFDRINRVTSLGYWMSRDHCRKGYMTKCVAHSIDAAFKIEKMNRLFIRCATQNKASRGIPIKLGLTHEGTQRQAEFLYDHFVDLDVFSILAEEWDSGILTNV